MQFSIRMIDNVCQEIKEFSEKYGLRVHCSYCNNTISFRFDRGHKNKITDIYLEGLSSNDLIYHIDRIKNSCLEFFDIKEDETCRSCCHFSFAANRCDSTRNFCKDHDHYSPRRHDPNLYSKIDVAELQELNIKDVIFNDPATIVLWPDGTKTVVKAENEKFDPEKGLAMAISKRVLGNKGNYYDEFRKWLPEAETNDVEVPSQDKSEYSTLRGRKKSCHCCEFSDSPMDSAECGYCNPFTLSNFKPAK